MERRSGIQCVQGERNEIPFMTKAIACLCHVDGAIDYLSGGCLKGWRSVWGGELPLGQYVVEQTNTVKLRALCRTYMPAREMSCGLGPGAAFQTGDAERPAGDGAEQCPLLLAIQYPLQVTEHAWIVEAQEDATLRAGEDKSAD